MKGIKGLLLIGVLVLTLFLSAGFVLAQQNIPGDQGGNGEKGKWADKLGLTADQQSKVEALQKDIQGKMKPLRDSDMDLLNQLKVLVDSTGSDSDINGVLDKLASNKTQEQDLEKQRSDGMKQILTPIQQAKMVLGMAKRKLDEMKKQKDKDDSAGNKDQGENK